MVCFSGWRGAVDAEREPADGAGHAAAVPEQVVEGLVGGLVHVGQAAVDELVERFQRDVEAGAGVGQGDQHRVGVVELASAGRRRGRP